MESFPQEITWLAGYVVFCGTIIEHPALPACRPNRTYRPQYGVYRLYQAHSMAQALRAMFVFVSYNFSGLPEQERAQTLSSLQRFVGTRPLL